MTIEKNLGWVEMAAFQYRKRYEVTCDETTSTSKEENEMLFQYRKRYEVTCDVSGI